MKFGFRTPSLKKRIAARTSWKRYVRHSMGLKAPRGWGWLTNPKRAAYNRIYNRTSFGFSKGRSQSSPSSEKAQSSALGCLLVLGLVFLFCCGGFGQFGTHKATPVAQGNRTTILTPQQPVEKPPALFQNASTSTVSKPDWNAIQRQLLEKREQLEAEFTRSHPQPTKPENPLHTWDSLDKKFSTDAVLVDGFREGYPTENEWILLQKTDGKEIKVPLFKVDHSDRYYAYGLIDALRSYEQRQAEWEASKQSHLASVESQIAELEQKRDAALLPAVDTVATTDADVNQSDSEQLVDFNPPVVNAIETLTGKVIKVSDGDTVNLLIDKETYRIRLEGIDAPETAQAYGSQSRLALAALINQKTISVAATGKDKYGRTLGFIHFNGENINERMVRDGWAWHYKKYNSSPILAEYERVARNEKRGLWADVNALAPWDFRARKSLAETPAQVESPAPTIRPLVASPTAPLTETRSHWLNSKSNIRHNRSCQYFGNTQGGHYCSPNDGRACKVCGG